MRRESIICLMRPWKWGFLLSLFAAGCGLAPSSVETLRPPGNDWDEVYSVKFSPDGQFLFAKAENLTTGWKTDSSQVVYSAKSEGGGLVLWPAADDVRIAGIAKGIAACKPNGTDFKYGKPILTKDSEGHWARGPIDWCAQARLLVVGHQDLLILLDPESLQVRYSLPFPDPGWFSGAAAANIRDWLIVRLYIRLPEVLVFKSGNFAQYRDPTTDTTTMRIIDTKDFSTVKEFTIPHTGGVGDSVRVSPDDRHFAVHTGTDCQVVLYDTAAWSERHVLAGHPGTVMDMAFSPDGKTLVVACVTGMQLPGLHLFIPGGLVFWDVETGKCIGSWSGGSWHASQFSSVAWSPDGKSIATGTRFGEVRLWKLK